VDVDYRVSNLHSPSVFPAAALDWGQVSSGVVWRKMIDMYLNPYPCPMPCHIDIRQLNLYAKGSGSTQDRKDTQHNKERQYHGYC
jgi:hypothetical protein